MVRQGTLTPSLAGSSPAIPAIFLPPILSNDSVAQSVEQLPFKPWVRGSSPRWVTKKKDTLRRVFLFEFRRLKAAFTLRRLKCSGEVNSPCAKIFALQKCLYSVNAPPRRAEPQSGLILFYQHRTHRSKVRFAPALFYARAEKASSARSLVPPFQSTLPIAGLQLGSAASRRFLITRKIEFNRTFHKK